MICFLWRLSYNCLNILNILLGKSKFSCVHVRTRASKKTHRPASNVTTALGSVVRLIISTKYIGTYQTFLYTFITASFRKWISKNILQYFKLQKITNTYSNHFGTRIRCSLEIYIVVLGLPKLSVCSLSTSWCRPQW